jgi:hypothetical protein
VSRRPATMAGPNERAGFMLIPDRGSSTVTYVATMRPTQIPVNRESQG